MMQVTLPDYNSNTTLRILADNATVLSLLGSVANNCSLGNTSAISPLPLNFSDVSAPMPEQAIQYYRGSSVVLTVEGYNDTAALSNYTSGPNTPLPGWMNESFVSCVNATIGEAVPLVNGDTSQNSQVPLTAASITLVVVGLWLMFWSAFI